MRASLAAGLLALAASAAAQGETVACHLTYGGETRLVEAAPAASPYAVAPVAIGSYFLFRIVFRTEPVDLAGIKLYAYADRDGGPQLIHQASHAYPAANRGADGFTGRHRVYEPVRDGELQYWCELKGGASA